MNNILLLKGRFDSQPNSSRRGHRNLPISASVSSAHLRDLANQLTAITTYWRNETLIQGALVSVYYTRIIPKSNRIQRLFAASADKVEASIRGARFEGTPPKQHVFTYYLKLASLTNAIELLRNAASILDKRYNGKITNDDIENLNKKNVVYRDKNPAKSSFIGVVVDAYFIERFAIDRDLEDIREQSIVSIYKTDVPTVELLSKLGIDMFDDKVIDETTLRLTPDELASLRTKAPYLIAMRTYDLSKITKVDLMPSENMDINTIPEPHNEPIVGVIDTPFSNDVYFSKWVSYQNMLDPNIELEPDDYNHGTAVSSIIVDGPAANPNLDDGCGRFRVRHFGVAKASRFSAFSVLKAIRQIVAQNRDIKVWNLSLGSALEISPNFISPEGAELDRIQSEYNVIFVVAGTNDNAYHEHRIRIGAPADSLNSIVVNSITRDHKPASYHRIGPVLSFFNKPDISYYGGDVGEPIVVCSSLGARYVCGTSIATPWITRKIAYLIHNLGLSREVAKAMLIDSAAGWGATESISCAIGFGIVPIRIQDVVKSKDDEIRFVLTGMAEEYETYTYSLPVPVVNGKHPFYARTTLCYFPHCNRSQGVDYTSTEMDLHFGRVKMKGEKAVVDSIDDNRQSNPEPITLYEEDARKLYRKWDNVKHICEKIPSRVVPRKSYESAMWGIRIITKERLLAKNGRGLQFGIVITLKEMYGKNRIDDFVKLCQVKGWLVSKLDIENRIDVYAKSEENIEFEQ